MVGALARRHRSIVASRARLRDRAVIHQGGFEKTRRRAVAQVARRRGGDVSSRFSAGYGTVVAPVARLRCAFEDTTRVAGLAGREFMRTNQRKSGRQVIEIEDCLRDRCAVRIGCENQQYCKKRIEKPTSPHVRFTRHVPTSQYDVIGGFMPQCF